MPLHFSDQEFADRRAKAVKAINDAKLDGLLMFAQESMYWLTGYDTFGYCFFQCLVLTADNRLTLLTRLPDLRQAQNTSNIQDIRIWRDDSNANPAQDLKDILNEFKLQNSKLGVEYDTVGLTGRSTLLIHEALDGFAKLQDQSEMMVNLRMIKSAQEIDYARRAAQLSDAALEAAWDTAQAGAFEGDILASMHNAIFRGGGDYAGNEFIIGSGDNALLCRYYSGRRHLDAQDQLTLEWSGAYRHYHAAMMRTIPIGTATDDHKRMHQACIDSLAACENALQPGQTVGGVFDAYANTMDSNGFNHARLNACGYSMSAKYTPCWMDWPMFYENNPTILQPGMIYFMHMILMDSDTNQAMCFGESYLVTENGNERLGKLTTDLVVR